MFDPLLTLPLIVGLLAARAGSSDIRDIGGVAFRAPVFAALFLIVALATLAMPGSSNFIGEFLILLGVFRDNLVIAIVAFRVSRQHLRRTIAVGALPVVVMVALLGMPTVVVVGRGYANGTIEIRDRFTGESAEVPVDNAVSAIVAAVRG